MTVFNSIKMLNEAEARAAINSLNGKELKGQQILVNKARPCGWHY
jgi:RNA recognition motif-containing protein